MSFDVTSSGSAARRVTISGDIDSIIAGQPKKRTDGNNHDDQHADSMEDKQNYNIDGHFVILFICVDDIPAEGSHFSLRAFLSDGNFGAEPVLYGKPVHTPTRSYNKNIIWNCFRDFGILPPAGAVLSIEFLDSDSSKEPLGLVHIAIDSELNNEDPKRINFDHRIPKVFLCLNCFIKKLFLHS